MANNPNQLIAVRVSLWADAEKSWNLLVDEYKNRDGFMRGVWFPKKLCKLRTRRKKDDVVRYILIAPRWLLEKNQVKILHKTFVE